LIADCLEQRLPESLIKLSIGEAKKEGFGNCPNLHWRGLASPRSAPFHKPEKELHQVQYEPD